jgi:hypothetical protein
MSADFRCGLTASFLDSGRILANAANAAAIVAGIGCAVASPPWSRLVLAGSLLFWFVECWFAMRAAIDSSLFRVMAADPEEAARQLDAMLGAAPFGAATVRERSLADRTRGALALWRKQIFALGVQFAALSAGIILRIANI